ncbi:MAG: MFS transporter [Alphaproteobacteria bacterium]|nr:MFS transporter [Alphaproteobacteria bacterium]
MSAMQAQAVVVGWQVYELTHSPLMLGLVGLAEAVPALLCALVSGHFVDTYSPQKIYRAAIATLTLNALILLVIAGQYIQTSDQFILAALYIGIAVSGFARSFIMPAAFSLLPMIVGRSEFSAAAAWQGTTMQMALIGGPALGGLIYGGYGAHGAWLFPLSIMMIGLALCTRINVPERVKTDAGTRPSAAKSIVEGWRFLLGNRALLSLMSLDMLAVLFGGAIAILPAFAHEVLGLGAEGLGILRSAPALGAVLTALFFALRPMRVITARRMLIVVGGFGVAMIGFGLSTSFASALVFLILAGAFDSVSVVIRGTLMQILTPDNMKGRVSAVNSMFIISSNEIGAFESGMAAAAFGLVPSIVMGGMGTLIVVGLVAALSPHFRKLRVET